jgi:pimeloyl-ACP methyl ester carboxylesterase
MATILGGNRRIVHFRSGDARLEGAYESPRLARGVVIFAHGSGSSRMSPRNRFVANELRRAGFATLLCDLLTEEEDAQGAQRFDIELLTRRLHAAVTWVRDEPEATDLPIALFGASTGAAAALQVAAALGGEIAAVVSRGGRPDLAGDAALARVTAPTLLIVGGHDVQVIQLNEAALAWLRCLKSVAVVQGATHLFEEPGALERVAALASDWFIRHVRAEPRVAAASPITKGAPS